MSSSRSRDRDKVHLDNYFHTHKNKIDISSYHKSSRSDHRGSPSSSKSSRKDHYHSSSPDDRRDHSGSKHRRETSPSYRRRERHSSHTRSRSRSRSRSPKSSRHHRSPPRWSERKAEDRRNRKLCVLEKLGIDLKQLDKPKEPTSSTAVPGLEGAIVRLPNQGLKKKLLWGSSTSKEDGSKVQEDVSKTKPSVWESARFSEDQDGRMTAKFQRLMGIKKEDAAKEKQVESKPGNKDLLKKQEELFSSMELQYEAARQATHTQRGVGLGFGRF